MLTVIVVLVLLGALVGFIALIASTPGDPAALRVENEVRLAKLREANAAEEERQKRAIRQGEARRGDLITVFVAAKEGDLELLQLALDHGFDVNRQDDDGWTLLHMAAFQGGREICEWLIGRGARRDARDSTGKTPADFARDGRHHELAGLLESRSARVDGSRA